MTVNVDSEIKQKITLALQNIQDNVDEGTRGLSRPDVKNDMVFWELGVLLNILAILLTSQLLVCDHHLHSGLKKG